MATREITKRDPRYEPDLERELVVEVEDASVARARTFARLATLWQERRFLARCAAIGLLGTLIIAFLIPVRYTSTTRLMPPDQSGAGMASMLAALGKAGGASGDLGLIGTELLGMRTTSDLFTGVLRSRTIQDDLVNKFDLRKVYGIRRMEDARKELDSRTEIASDRKSGIITIRVSDHDAKRAAAMAQEYVAGLNEIVINLNTSSAHKEKIFLEQRLAEVQQDLERAEKQFSDFASQHTTIDIKEQGRAMIGAAADLEGELIATRTQLEGLRQIYTENNVRVRALQARVNELQRQLQKMGGKPESAEDNGSTETEDLYPSIRRLPVLGVQYADLFRRQRIQEAVYETLTKQYELAKVEEARETPSVKVLDVGDVPERKSFPPRTLFALLGMIFFFSVGCVWVLASAKWQQIDPRHPGKMLAEEIFDTVRRQPVNFVRLSRRIAYHSAETKTGAENPDRQR
jgi:uncharacterized protein involved in exopolysaccharide biosynthesis